MRKEDEDVCVFPTSGLLLSPVYHHKHDAKINPYVQNDPEMLG